MKRMTDVHETIHSIEVSCKLRWFQPIFVWKRFNQSVNSKLNQRWLIGVTVNAFLLDPLTNSTFGCWVCILLVSNTSNANSCVCIIYELIGNVGNVWFIWALQPEHLCWNFLLKSVVSIFLKLGSIETVWNKIKLKTSN